MSVMRLFAGEWRKLGANRFLFLLLLFLLLADLAVVARAPYEKDPYGAYVSAMLEEYRAAPEAFLAECTEQQEYLKKITELQNEYDSAEQLWEIFHPGEPFEGERPVAVNRYVPEELEDAVALERFFAVLNREETANAAKDAMIERAKNFYEYYKSTGKQATFAAQYQVRLVNRYLKEDRRALTYPATYAHGWDVALEFGGDGILLLAAAILLGSMLVLPDRTGGFALILRTAKRGRAATMLAKGAVGAVLSLLVTVLFSGVTLLALHVKIGLAGAGLPLQCFFPYALTHLKVWQAMLIRTGIRALGVYCAVLFTALLSVLFRHGAAVYGCAGAIGALFYVLAGLNPFHEHSPFQLFNIFTVFAGDAYFAHWNAVSLFGQCYDYALTLPLLLFGTAAVLLWAGVLCFSHRAMGAARTGNAFAGVRKALAALPAKFRAAHPQKSPRTHTQNITAWEWRKLFGGALPFLLCLLFAVFGTLFTIREIVTPLPYREYLEREYLNTLEGEYTEEKRQYLETLAGETAEIIDAYSDQSAAYRAGEISDEEYTAYIRLYNDAKNREPTVKALLAKAEYLDRLAEKGVKTDLVYSVGWERLFAAAPDYLLAAFLLLMLSGIWVPENKDGFSLILYSTKYGRSSTARGKLRVALALSAVCGALSALLRVALIAGTVGLGSFRSPAAGVEVFGGFGGSLLGMLLLWLLCRVVGAMLLGALCFALSALFGKTLPVITLGALGVFAIPLLHLFGVTAMDGLLMDGLLGGTAPLLKKSAMFAALGWCALAAVLLAAAWYRLTGKDKKGGPGCN